MEVRVELGGIVRMVSPEGFLSSCGRGSVKVRANALGRVVLCGPFLAVERARGILRASPELEAGVLVELAKGDPALAALLGADGLADGALDAALGIVGPEWPEDQEVDEG